MYRFVLAAFGFPLLIAGCATAPVREPVLPEPNIAQPDNPECHALWSNGIDTPKLKFESPPYGWAIVRIDVERGVVTKVEMLDGSPRKVVEAPTIAHYREMRFRSLASAQGCIIRHKWD